MTVSWLHSKPPPLTIPDPPAERPTLRAVSAGYSVTFTAPCPCCGQDAEWTTRQSADRPLITVDCSCPVPA